MSLINQMLIDLEERGANSGDVEVKIANNLSAANTPNQHPIFTKNTEFSLIRMGGVMVLLAGATYLWTQNTQAESRIDLRQKISNLVHIAAINKMPVAPLKTSEAPLQTTTEDSTNNTADITAVNQVSPLFETELKFNIADLQVEAVKSSVKPQEKTHLNANSETSRKTELAVPTEAYIAHICPNRKANATSTCGKANKRNKHR
jgi:hypothetical protein